MNKIIENIKSGNYEVVDNKGVSITNHFTQCLEKEFADLETKLAEKEKEIKKLEEQLKNAIVPKFNRQEHIYCVAFGEIKEFIVVAYLDNNITLCEDTTTNKLEWCDNKFLVLTKEEAEIKLRELKGD